MLDFWLAPSQSLYYQSRERRRRERRKTWTFRWTQRGHEKPRITHTSRYSTVTMYTYISEHNRTQTQEHTRTDSVIDQVDDKTTYLERQSQSSSRYCRSSNRQSSSRYCRSSGSTHGGCQHTGEQVTSKLHATYVMHETSKLYLAHLFDTRFRLHLFLESLGVSHLRSAALYHGHLLRPSSYQLQTAAATLCASANEMVQSQIKKERPLYT